MSEQLLPIVSAIIPTRNRPGMVVRAVQSVLQQTVSAVEAIVVIDGPDQDTESALKPLLGERVRVLSLDSSVGGAEARNRGVRAANGTWVAFLDDDDEWLPEKLSRQLESAQSARVPYPVICTRMIARSPLNDRIWPRRLPKLHEPMSEYLFCRRGLGHGDAALQTSTILTTRALMLDLPFEPGLKRHQDWDWILRASAHPGVQINVLPEPLSIYSVEGQRASVGRAADSAFSLEWARSRRSMITAKAYSFFIATECVPRARKSREGMRTYLQLLREFTFGGSPRPSSCALFLLFLLVSEQARHKIRDILSRAPRHGSEETPGASERTSVA